MKIMASACLAGDHCKYNGGNNRNEKVLRLMEEHEVITVCPEQMGGLPTPRVPSEIKGGVVTTRDGRIVDTEFRNGAAKCLEIAMRERPDLIVLQSRSPSCGVKQRYDGTFTGTLVDGSGVTAALLLENGFHVLDVEDLIAVHEDVLIRKLYEDEVELLKDFLYEAIFIPEGAEPPARDIVERPELQVYYSGFGRGAADHCLVAEADGHVVGAVWTRIMNDYGHIDDETPSFAISLISGYRRRGIGTRLMREMLLLLKTQGFKQASLAVQKANHAVRMYKNVGFEILDESEEEFIMVCSLSGLSMTDSQSEKIIENAVRYIQELFRANAGGHDADHTLRVYKNTLRIAKKEPDCDLRIAALAALLHDADDHKLFATDHNANARAFLQRNNVPAHTIDRICRVINSVSFSKNKGRVPDTPEGKVVQDADRLDAMGAVGIARTFAYGGEHGRPMSESIQHFYDKLLRLKDLMNTDTGRQIAGERHAFLEKFLDEYFREEEGL